ncbi:helix-turn-helix domain-containing protein [Pedobacter agri]|uniref:Helix-turn-helix domain-containing protein n=1 Tax=Pedobacter agri TaxID=454586 RepID=A0A9X3DGE9_9SPHI|nr:helix-turn-helix domain-containing protein [Pedobacter agri]MCX3265665.1 helix-turn-helix domain-containing protein [Pedobacter agri]
MEQEITKDDLHQFSLLLTNVLREEIRKIQIPTSVPEPLQDWIKTTKVRKLLDMSPGTVQNLRIEGKVRYKKIMGTYYYNLADLEKLFKDRKNE